MKKWFEVYASAEVSINRTVEANSKEEAMAIIEEETMSKSDIFNISSIEADEIID